MEYPIRSIHACASQRLKIYHGPIVLLQSWSAANSANEGGFSVQNCRGFRGAGRISFVDCFSSGLDLEPAGC